MNVAHCIHGLTLGGAQQVIKNLVGARSDPRFDYHVYCSLDGPMRPSVERAGARVRVLPRRFSKLDPFWIRDLVESMRLDQIDLVHTHLFGDTLHGYLASRLAGRLPTVATLHSRPDILTPLQNRAYGWLIARFDRVVACSEAVNLAYRERGGSGVERIITITNGIDFPTDRKLGTDNRTSIREAFGLDPGGVVIATIGRLSSEKGLDTLISAFAQVRAQSGHKAQLVIAGDGPLLGDLETQARRSGEGDSIVFPGFVNDIPALLAVTDILVISSRSEGLPIALLEAMAAGCCVLATDLPGILEAVRPEAEARIVEPGNSDELHRGLVELISDQELRKRLGDAARSRFQERFTARRMVESYERLYAELLGGKR